MYKVLNPGLLFKCKNEEYLRGATDDETLDSFRSRDKIIVVHDENCYVVGGEVVNVKKGKKFAVRP